MARRSRRAKRDDSSEGATDIAFLILFLLLFALVNVREGDPSAPRLMTTAPIFRVAEPDGRPTPQPESWVLVRVFEHGYDRIPTGAGCRPLTPGAALDRPGIVTVTRMRPGAVGNKRRELVGGLHCTVDGDTFGRLRRGEPLYLGAFGDMFTEGLSRGPIDVVILELNREIAFQFVVEVGEALRASLPPGSEPVHVRYRGFSPSTDHPR